jgi:glyoxalase family protein
MREDTTTTNTTNITIQPIVGLHHVTMMVGMPQPHLDFYGQTLGQRLVKSTVNFDDPGTYHFYFGNQSGAPGTIHTSFPWLGAVRGQRGNGEAVALAYRVGQLDGWREKLSKAPLTQGTRFGQRLLQTQDPDGLWVELIEDEAVAAAEIAGFHSLTLWVEQLAVVEHLLTVLGYQPLAAEADAHGTRRTRFVAPGATSASAGHFLDVVERPGQPRGRLGVGSIHHLALRAANGETQAALAERLRFLGYQPTPVQERQYFRSVYLRDRSGILFEIATDQPGFAIDEAADQLGQTLKLPAWLEPQRGQIAQHLPAVIHPNTGLPVQKTLSTAVLS